MIKGGFKPSTEVLARLGEAFNQNTSMKKTQIHFASRISWSSFDRYLQWLQNKNYLKCVLEETDKQYILTEHGIRMFKIILELKECVKETKILCLLMLFVFVHENLDEIVDLVI